VTTQRFFVRPEWIQEGSVQISGPLSHQISSVLRMRPGDAVIVLDNSGWEYEVELKQIDKERVIGQVAQKRLAIGEPRTKVRLYQGVMRSKRFEWVLQKGTELGIVEFVPVICDRCLMSSLDDISEARMTRWQRIILEAAEQSGRGRLPRLHSPILFPQACERTRQEGLALTLWEGEETTSLKRALQSGDAMASGRPGARSRRPFSISLHVGPEGGLTPDEVQMARRYGAIPVTLGPRVLRAETAGIVAVSALLYEFGDLEYTAA
jgi:16S rRNA (uracil1498-N3)-methyltransferase